MKWTENQEKAINWRNNDLIISAGAGSGKTTTMIERAVKLISEGVPIERMMILAFNVNAAAEIKARLRNRLIEFAKSNPEKIDLIKTQLDNFYLADIGTIHGYCNKIVAEFFEQIGQSPDLDVLDEADAKELQARAMKNALQKYEADPEIRDLLDKLSLRKDDAFTDLVRTVYDYMVTQSDREWWLENSSKTLTQTEFIYSSPSIFVTSYVANPAKVFADRVRELRTYGVDINDVASVKYADGLLGILELFENCSTIDELYDAYTNKENNPRRSPSKTTPYDPILIERLSEICKEFNAVYLKLLDGIFKDVSFDDLLSYRNHASEQIRVLVKAVKIFQNEYDAIKQAEKRVDFDDLQRYAWEILKIDEIRAELVSRHDHVFVDEVQDVNYVQNSIIRALAPKDGLFMVGDVKQSIYRFRLAEPKIFLKTFNEWNKENKALFFKTNYRSDPHILTFVNKIFSLLMTEGFGDLDYKNDGAFVVEDREIYTEVPPVCVLQPEGGTQKELEKPQATGDYDIFESLTEEDEDSGQEAGLIYNYIQSILGKKITVKGEIRTVEYKDIVILCRARAHAKKIIKALSSENVPLNLGTFEESIGGKELDVLMDYLAVLDNLYDDYSLISVLHSYIGGMTNNQLADVRLNYPKASSFADACLSYADADHAYSSKLKSIFEQMDKFRTLSSVLEMSAFVKTVLEETGFATYIASSKGGLQVIAALNGYIYSLKGKSYADDLHSLVLHYRQNEKPKLKGVLTDLKGVSFYTCHETKGLEYPVVIMAGLDKYYDASRGTVYADNDFGIAMKYFEPKNKVIYDTFDMKAISLKKKMQEKEDALRLLYVALTRAQSVLCVCMPKPFGNTKLLAENSTSFGELFRNCFSYDPTLNAYVQKLAPKEFSISLEEKVAYPEELPKDKEIESILSFSYPYKKATGLRSKYSVSEVNSGEALTLPAFSDEQENNVRGTNYHLVMQYIDLYCQTLKEVEENIQSMVLDGLLSPDQAEEIDPNEILACLNSPIGKMARENEIMREKRFVLRKKASELFDDGGDDYTLIQGTMDMLILGEETVVVDFKKSSASVPKLKERYKKQLDLYAEAVETSLGKKVDKKLLYVFGRDIIVSL